MEGENKKDKVEFQQIRELQQEQVENEVNQVIQTKENLTREAAVWKKSIIIYGIKKKHFIAHTESEGRNKSGEVHSAKPR